MPAKVIPLKESGLIEVKDVAARFESDVRNVQRWIADGRLPVHAVGGGNRTVYLVRIKDLAGFEKPTLGRPKGKAANTKKEKARGKKAKASGT